MLHYSISGDGFPVVFIHGFLESNTMWSKILPNFPNHKKIAVELLGHGNSPDPNADLSIVHLANEVMKVIEQEKIQKFIVVGHSLGGYVALEIGKKWGKERCQHIALLNSHPFEDSAIKKEERTKVARIVTKNKSLFIRQAIPNLFRAPEVHQVAVKHLIDEALNMSEESIALTTIAMRDRSSREDVMMDYATDLTVIQGKHDKLIPFEKMQVITSECKNNFYLLEEAGHMAHVEAYDEVVRLLQLESHKSQV
jgi:2-succinyl-6-hydroxy-2,4-cyclohexadiene-1-carboxylate synthase